MEQELKLELQERAILLSDDHRENAALCASLWRQNWYKDEILKNCLGRIGDLEGQLVYMELQQSRPWWRRLFSKKVPPDQTLIAAEIPVELQSFVD